MDALRMSKSYTIDLKRLRLDIDGAETKLDEYDHAQRAPRGMHRFLYAR